MTYETKNRSWWCILPWLRTEPIFPQSESFYSEEAFRRKLMQERKRAERSQKPLLVMLVNAGYLGENQRRESITHALREAISCCVRETDICGLANSGRMIGVILTEVAPEKVESAKTVVAGKARAKLEEIFENDVAGNITVTFRVLPESGGKRSAFDMMFFPEIDAKGPGDAVGRMLKRAIDVFGSFAGLILLTPAFAVIALVIKLTSQGPVFFTQDRVGCNGKKFKLFKFRTMFVGNDDRIHREYVKKLIKGELGEEQNGVFKIKGDPRTTPVGKLLRKFSVDELPQLLNVLKGDMSLVGPRPPILYELEEYWGWQRNRLIGWKPGITGAWQVSGRSSTTFDQMVRLDLRYLNGWSVLLDLKILGLTPIAVLKCRGAY